MKKFTTAIVATTLSASILVAPPAQAAQSSAAQLSSAPQSVIAAIPTIPARLGLGSMDGSMDPVAFIQREVVRIFADVTTRSINALQPFVRVQFSVHTRPESPSESDGGIEPALRIRW